MTTNDVNGLLHPCRVLLGWMEEEPALRIQFQNRSDLPISEAARERARAARETVAAREPGIDQEGVIMPPPESLGPYIETLKANEAAAALFAEGWAVSVVDLRRLCAVQPKVFIDHGQERVRDVDPDDMASLAAVSLPLPVHTVLPAHFDEGRNVWVITSPNPNLRVMGHFANPVRGAVGLGFAVAVGQSFLKVYECGGRHFLTDGYHRAAGFLLRNISHVPALTRRVPPGQPLDVPAGMLPQAAYLGERPPAVRDYLDDSVSAAVELPALQKWIVVQALEVLGY